MCQDEASYIIPLHVAIGARPRVRDALSPQSNSKEGVSAVRVDSWLDAIRLIQHAEGLGYLVAGQVQVASSPGLRIRRLTPLSGLDDGHAQVAGTVAYKVRTTAAISADNVGNQHGYGPQGDHVEFSRDWGGKRWTSMPPAS